MINTKRQPILSPRDLLALAIDSERLGFYGNARSFYEQYVSSRPDLRSVFDSSLQRCAGKLGQKFIDGNPQPPPSLSIVIPVYNSDAYLDQCLHSVRSQSLNDIEIIVVNDGSSDKSLEIIARHKQADPRVRLINNEMPSGSAGKPRNQALALASGAYVGFVDSDDWVESDYFQSLYSVAAAENADLVISAGFNNVLGSVTEERRYNNYFFNRSSSVVKTYHQSSMIWDKIYSKRLLDGFGIYLGEGPAAVDVFFNLKSYFYANKVSIADITGYNYRRETSGSVTVRFRKKSNCEFEINAYRDVFDWVDRACIESSYVNYCRIKQLTSFAYTCKIIKIDYLALYFKKCVEIIAKYSRKSFENVLAAASLRYLVQDFTFFCEGSLGGFISKYRRDDIALLLPAGKLEIPKTVITSAEFSRGRMGNQKGVIFAPDWSRSNQYQSLFYSACSQLHDYSCFGLDAPELCLDNIKHLASCASILHFHWLHPFTKNDSRADEFFEIVQIVKAELGLRLVWTVHNLLPHESVDSDRDLRIRARFAELCDRLICHSRHAKQLAMDAFSVPAGKIRVVPHGTYPVEGVNPSIPAPSSGSRLKLLMLGALRPYKNVDWAVDFIDAFNQRSCSESHIELILCGKPVSDQQKLLLEQRATTSEWLSCELRRLADDELRDRVLTSDFVFIPYRDVLTSGVALYAISCGRPFLAKYSDGLAEVGGEGSKILYQGAADLESLLKRLAASKADGSLRERFSSQRIAAETAHLDWNQVLIDDPYAGLCHSGG